MATGSKKTKPSPVKPAMARRAKEFLALAKEVIAESNGWHDAHNRLFGPGTHFIRHFPTRDERMEFGRTPEADELKKILAEIPRAPAEEDDEAIKSANGHITLRVPKSLHAALIAEADAEDVSLNQLLLTKAAVQLKAIM